MTPEKLLEEFRQLIAEDRRLGRVRSLESYQELFPGHEELIAGEYARDGNRLPQPIKPPSSAGSILDRLPRGDSGLQHEGEIARGGMGAIERVRDDALQRALARKVMLPHHESDALYVNRFLEEAQVTAQLDHPGVVPVHQLGRDADGRLFFTMKLVKGRTLSQIFELVRSGRENWTKTRAIGLFIRICDTLAFAHQKGVVHRDLKPANIMVGNYGELYVMDWGLAKVLGDRAEPADPQMAAPEAQSLVQSVRSGDTPEGADSPTATVAGDVLGTPAYMPLEQAMSFGPDARSDIYAVGAMLYELLAGHHPYADKKRSVQEIVLAIVAGAPTPIHKLKPKLPGEILAICDKAMARDPVDRYQTAGELAQELRNFIEGRVVHAYRTGPWVEFRKWIGRNRALAAALAAAVFIAVAGSIGFALHARGAAEKIALERDKEAAARVRAEGLRLSARAGNEGAKLPALALGLAIEGAKRAEDAYGRTALYRALANLHEIATLEAHLAYANAVAFDETAERLVSVSGWNGEVIVWDLAKRAPLFRMVSDQGYVLDPLRHIAFAPFGRRVALASNDGTLKIWDTTKGESLQVFEPGAAIESMSWDGAGERLAMVTAAGRLRVWRPPAEESELDLDLGANGNFAVALRHGGARIAVQLPDGSVTVRDVGTGAEIAKLPVHADGPKQPCKNSRLAWLDGGRLLLSWRDDPEARAVVPGRAEVWDVFAAKRIAAFGSAEAPCSIPVWDASGASFALPISDGGKDVIVWDAAARRERCRLGAAAEFIYAFSRNGRHLVTSEEFHASEPNRFGYAHWDAHTGTLRARLRGHTYMRAGAAVTNDGLVATAANDTTVRLWRAPSPLTCKAVADWDLGNGVILDLFADLRRAFVIPDGHKGGVECRTVPEGRTLYTLPGGYYHFMLARTRNRVACWVPETNRVQVLDALDGRLLVDWPGPVKPDRRIGVVLAPDGSKVMTVNKGRVEFRDADDGTRLGGFDPGLGPHLGARWFPDGRSVLFYKGRERQLFEYDVATGALVRRFEGAHTGTLTSVRVSPSGTKIATAAADRSVVVWERKTGKILHRFRGLVMGDMWLNFDPTERFLVVRTRGDTTVILDVEKREVFAEVPAPYLGYVAFDRGDFIATGAGHETLRVPLDPLAAARHAQPRPLTPLEVGIFDVGNAEERAALEDQYVAWTHAPHRIVWIALRAAADGDRDRAETHLARLDEIAPDCAERLVVQAALHVDEGDDAAALSKLEHALRAGCSPRLLRAPVFGKLRDNDGWQAVEKLLNR